MVCREDGGVEIGGSVAQVDVFAKKTRTGEVTGFGCKVGN
jgi:hypothetical protein